MKKFFKKAFKSTSSRENSSQAEEGSSRPTPRRYSVSEMGISDSDRSLRRDQGLHGCSSRFAVNIDEVLEPSRRRTRSSTRAQDQAPQPMNVDEDQWKFTPEGFSLRTNLKELRPNSESLVPDLLYLHKGELIGWKKFMTEEGESSQQPPSSGWGAWETPSAQPSQHFMAEEFRAGSSSYTPVFNPRAICSFDPTTAPVFNPSAQFPPPPAFVPRSARFHAPGFISAQNMPQQAFYGIENMTAENYQIIDQIRINTNQFEQNTQTIEEQLHNLRVHGHVFDIFFAKFTKIYVV
ncbi:hypothetical protein U9M48_027627 [Paspalum notatum var. saurae]|uniref:Uncharacterized protein n=1 Tax=Paspalum notatum var. saurae TaxID=547442 RepID=A0AAQ3TWU1_PASNO